MRTTIYPPNFSRQHKNSSRTRPLSNYFWQNKLDIYLPPKNGNKAKLHWKFYKQWKTKLTNFSLLIWITDMWTSFKDLLIVITRFSTVLSILNISELPIGTKSKHGYQHSCHEKKGSPSLLVNNPTYIILYMKVRFILVK